MKQLLMAAAVGGFLAPLACFGQTTVFSDNFSSSTLDGAGTAPTATSTGYQIASTKSTTGSSISAGDLKLTFGSTSSGIAEVQALFTTTPVSLVNVGDSIDLNISFTDTSGLLPSASSFVGGGLYNSGGAAPLNNGQLASSGINGTAGSSFATGNAAGWAGYVGLIRPSTTSSTIVTRPVQSGTGTTSVNQELIGDDFSSTGGYDNPAGTTLHSKSATVTLTAPETLDFDLTLTLSAAGTVTATDTLTETGTSPTTLFTDTATATGANLVAQSFDGFAFGDRDGAAGAANTIDINGVTITDSLATPEPSTLALSGLGIAILAAARRRFRK